MNLICRDPALVPSSLQLAKTDAAIRPVVRGVRLGDGAMREMPRFKRQDGRPRTKTEQRPASPATRSAVHRPLVWDQGGNALARAARGCTALALAALTVVLLVIAPAQIQPGRAEAGTRTVSKASSTTLWSLPARGLQHRS